jgi:hypothetical protein
MASAQGSTSPLIVVPLEGDTKYVYENGEFKPMDFCLPESGGRPSILSYAPDGQQFAFLTSSTTGQQSEVWVCDLAARTGRLIAPIAVEAIVRSTPTWSPDSAQIAWAETDQNTNLMQVILYNLADGTQSVLYERQAASSAFVVPSLDWGSGGLVFYDLLQPETEGADLQAVVTLVAPNTEPRQIALESSNVADYARWTSYNNQNFILLRDTSLGDFTVIDPATSAVSTIHGQLSFYSRTAPDGISVYSTNSPAMGTYAWAVMGADFSTTLNIEGNEYGIAISPDGQQVAFLTFESYPWGGKAYVMNDFVTYPPAAQQIDTLDAGYSEPGVLYVFWTPLAVRII